MKILQFTIPVQHDKAVVTRVDVLPYFYPYLHRHKEMQITWIQRGDGTLVSNNNMHIFESNDIFIIGDNQPHVFKSSAPYFASKKHKSVCSLDIFFDPEIICDKLLNIPELKNLQFFLKQCRSGFKVPKEYTATISTKMLLIYQNEDSTSRIIHFIELLRILSSLPVIEELSDFSSISFSSESDGIRISRIYKFIMDNYHRNLPLQEVAQQAYMTPHAFCRFFKRHTRHTFISFLNQIRVNEARKQFSEGNFDSISGVAYNCGFNSITSFNRVFKSVAKISPSAYIETLKENLHTQKSNN